MRRIIIWTGLVLLTPMLALAQNSTDRCREVTRAQGTLPGTSRQQTTFRINSVVGPESMQGKVSYTDRASGVKFRSSELVEYVVIDDASRTLKFQSVDTNGVPIMGTFVICDFGRGTNDVIGVFIDGGYEKSAHLRRGNIAIRQRNCPDD